MAGSDATVLKVGRHFRFVVVGQNTLLVERKDARHIKLSINNSSVKNFLHHLLFTGLAIGSSNEVGLFNFCLGRAVLVSAACHSFGSGQVWSAFFISQVTILGQISMEEGPAAVATFIHVVALHQILS